MTGQSEILREWKDLPGPLDLSFKYAIAHMYSIPDPPFIHAALPYLGGGSAPGSPCGTTTSTAFAGATPSSPGLRQEHAGPGQVRRLLHGAGRLHLGPRLPRRATGHAAPAIIEKQWYSFMLWGRLATTRICRTPSS